MLRAPRVWGERLVSERGGVSAPSESLEPSGELLSVPVSARVPLEKAQRSVGGGYRLGSGAGGLVPAARLAAKPDTLRRAERRLGSSPLRVAPALWHSSSHRL